MSTEMNHSVSFIIPMYNASATICKVIDALISQNYAGATEIIVINDGSSDNSRELIDEYESGGKISVIDQDNQGAVSSTNTGIRAAKFDFICSVDSDVVLIENWLSLVMPEFDDETVAAVQGYYKTPEGVDIISRVMGYDVEQRYDDIPTKYVSHVCTGDTVYRRSALEKVGEFDPEFRYGYDNDMSYRLGDVGYRLIIRKDAKCDHYWKADIGSYAKQQYLSGFGRMQLITKHWARKSGDSVSGLRMIMQLPLTLGFALMLLFGMFAGSTALLLASMVVGCVMIVDRVHFALKVASRHNDAAVILMPFVHVFRNFIWLWALIVWASKKLLGSK